MVRGRFVSSLLAVGTLLFFTNVELAWADDAGWIAAHTEGICTGPIPTGQALPGGGGCGFLWIHCISRVARDSYAAVTGTAMGLFIGVGAALAVGALVVTAPVWVTVGVVAAGVALTGYGIYSTVKGWSHMSEQQKIYTVGMWGGSAVGGGLGAHYVPSLPDAPDPAAGAGDGVTAGESPYPAGIHSDEELAALQRAVRGEMLRAMFADDPFAEPGPNEPDWASMSLEEVQKLPPPAVTNWSEWDREVFGEPSKVPDTVDGLFREAGNAAWADVVPHGPVEFPGGAWRGMVMPQDDALAAARWIYQQSEMHQPFGGLRGINDLLHTPGLTQAQVKTVIDELMANLNLGREKPFGLEYTGGRAVPGLDTYLRGWPGQYGVWDQATQSFVLRNGVQNDPAVWLQSFGHAYGQFLADQVFQGEVPTVEVGGEAVPFSQILDRVTQQGG